MKLSESLKHKDMVRVIKPTIHIDEFSSKMGDDNDIVVISFFVRNEQAANDLIRWFEKGYNWVLDAERSPGEIRPGRYLVYIECPRRTSLPKQIETIIKDLESLTEHKLKDWDMLYNHKYYKFSKETFAKLVPLSPKEHRDIEDLVESYINKNWKEKL